MKKFINAKAEAILSECGYTERNLVCMRYNGRQANFTNLVRRCTAAVERVEALENEREDLRELIEKLSSELMELKAGVPVPSIELTQDGLRELCKAKHDREMEFLKGQQQWLVKTIELMEVPIK